MKINEILESCGDAWFRPVSWRGVRSAFCVRDGEVYQVPSSRGGVPGMTRIVSWLTGDWEVVDAGDVLEGR